MTKKLMPGFLQGKRMTPRVDRIIRHQLQEFKKKFGREPGPGDPVFFDPDADHPTPYDPEKMKRQTLEAMRAAGTRPELIFAYERTGFVVNREGYRQMSRADRAEYDAAIDEYFATQKGGSNGD